MDKILQFTGFVTLLIIAYFAGFISQPSIPFIDSEKELISEIDEAGNEIVILSDINESE